MKRLLFLLLFIPAFAIGQSVYTYGGKAVTYGGDVAIQKYCDEYQAVYDAYTTKPDPATAAIWNTCVETWVANGEWATKDIIYVYAAHTNGAGEALINWKNPGTFDATAFNAPTFTANQGFLGNGSTQYINTGGWIPATHGVNFTRNSASQIIYIRTQVNSVGVHGTGYNADTKDCRIIPYYSDVCYIRINCGTNATGAVTNGSGMFINTRTAAAVNKVYRNKVAIIEATTVSSGAPVYSPYCLATSVNAGIDKFRADQVSLYAFGAGMTQTHVNNFCDPFNAAMTALGTNVY